MSRVCFVIFAHCDAQSPSDIDDMIDNISRFHKDCDFIVNHPTMDHPKIFTRHRFGILNKSSFIFGAFEEIVSKLTEDQIKSFDHFYLVSANQYFINPIIVEKNINYFQFYNTEDWSNSYNGMNTAATVSGFPLKQPYGRWDDKNLYSVLDIPTPMASNWESGTLTQEAMLLCKKYISTAVNMYPATDLISLFPGYMALKTNQAWKYPAFFGTFDPSNRPQYNHVISQEQVIMKYNEEYSSIKRVNYSKDCPIKGFIRNNYYKQGK